jgi:chitosanase
MFISLLLFCSTVCSPVLQYGYCENIGDGRGYTAGRAGFTTGTSDLLYVVTKYTATSPNNILAPLLPALKQVDGTSSTAGLSTLCTLWAQAAANDPVFRATQDAVSDEYYFNPALAYCTTLNLQLALSIGQLYDTCIQHGDGGDPDSLGAIITQTKTNMGGSPATGIDEKAWMVQFIANRKYHLQHAADPATRTEWAASVDRVDCYSRIVAANNWNLNLPMSITAYGDSFTLVADAGSGTGSGGNCLPCRLLLSDIRKHSASSSRAAFYWSLIREVCPLHACCDLRHWRYSRYSTMYCGCRELLCHWTVDQHCDDLSGWIVLRWRQCCSCNLHCCSGEVLVGLQSITPEQRSAWWMILPHRVSSC